MKILNICALQFKPSNMHSFKFICIFKHQILSKGIYCRLWDKHPYLEGQKYDFITEN